MAAVVYSFRDPPGRVNDLIDQLLESGSSYELKIGSAVAILVGVVFFPENECFRVGVSTIPLKGLLSG